jgi:hypothetical protein
MTGHRSFKELTKDLSPERKARVVARVLQLNADMQRSREDSACQLNIDSDQLGGSS